LADKIENNRKIVGQTVDRKDIEQLEVEEDNKKLVDQKGPVDRFVAEV
jgi:hypothetical protein